MNVEGKVAIVSGGAGGLGEATVRALLAAGANVAVLDLDADRGKAIEDEFGDRVLFRQTDVTDEDSVGAAVDAAATWGDLRFAVIAHGRGGGATRTVRSDGTAHDFDVFKRYVDIYLNGTFNVLRLAAAAIGRSEPDPGGERGAVVMTASIAGIEGQIGQVAYAAAKGGVIGMTIVAARDLAVLGIRVVSIAPGTFATPAYALPPDELDELWGPRVPFPPRMGRPEEFAGIALEACRNSYLNGETIRIDGALRFPPRYPSAAKA